MLCGGLTLAGCEQPEPRPLPTVDDLPRLRAEPAVVFAEPGEVVDVEVTNEGASDVRLTAISIGSVQDAPRVEPPEWPVVLEPGASVTMAVSEIDVTNMVTFVAESTDVEHQVRDGWSLLDRSLSIQVVAVPEGGGTPAELVAGGVQRQPTTIAGERAFVDFHVGDARGWSCTTTDSNHETTTVELAPGWSALEASFVHEAVSEALDGELLRVYLVCEAPGEAQEDELAWDFAIAWVWADRLRWTLQAD